MIKVLKSFDSAHSAVSWMTQNRIAGTSIETTGTLKSTGMGRIPSGNYHVVLKGRARDLIETHNEDEARGEQNPRVAGALEGLATWSDNPGRLAKKFAGMINVKPPRNELDTTQRDRLAGMALHVLQETGHIDHVTDPKHLQASNATLSISREDLVSVITKSIMDVLKDYNPDDFRARFEAVRQQSGPLDPKGPDTHPLFERLRRGEAGAAAQAAANRYREQVEKGETPDTDSVNGHLEAFAANLGI